MIGAQLERNRRTIERELVKGMTTQLTTLLEVYSTYSADVAQIEHERKGQSKGPCYKIGNDHQLASYIEKSITSGDSPYATLERIKNNNKLKIKTSICIKT